MINLISFSPFITEVSVQEIEGQLKKHQWFRDYLVDKSYWKLIIQDQVVREVIGELDKDSYQEKCQKRAMESK